MGRRGQLLGGSSASSRFAITSTAMRSRASSGRAPSSASRSLSQRPQASEITAASRRPAAVWEKRRPSPLR